MGSMWLKVRIWTKVTLFALLVIYVIAFILENNSERVKFWYFPYRTAQTSVFLLTFYTFLAGVIGYLIVRTTFKTLRQIRDLRRKSQAERLEREVADMRSKAAMLRAKPIPGDEPDPPLEESTGGMGR